MVSWPRPGAAEAHGAPGRRVPHALVAGAQFKWQTYFIAVVLFVPSLIDFIAVRKTYQRLSRQEWAVIAALSAALPLAPIFMTRAIWYFYLDVVAVAEQLPPLLILGGGMRLLRERHSLRFVPIVLFSVLGSFLLFSNRYAAQHEGRSFFSFFAFVLLAVVSATAAVLFPRHLLQHSRSRVSPMELASAQTAGSFLVLTVYAFLVAPAVRAAPAAGSPPGSPPFASRPAVPSCPAPFQGWSSRLVLTRPSLPARSWLLCCVEWEAGSRCISA